MWTGRLDRARTRRRAGQGRRHRAAPALPVRSDHAASASTPARWSTSTSTCRTSRSSSGSAFSAISTSPWSRSPPSCEDGRLIPSSSVGNNKTWLDQADKIILEVNSWQNAALEGMHDIYYGTALPPNRKPIPLIAAGDRIGETYFRCDPEQDRRRRRDQAARPQHAVRAARRELAGDRRPHPRISAATR